MTQAVICYVPGSGGVRLINMLTHAVPTRNFKHLDHYHEQVPKERDPDGLEIAQILRQLPDHPDTLVSTTLTKPSLFPRYHDGNLLNDDGQITEPYHTPFYATPCHCMDYNIVKQYHPGRYQVKIVCDIVTALKRWWIVYAQYKILNEPRIASCHDSTLAALETPAQKLIARLLIMHLEYYNNYYDAKADIVLDLRHDHDEFSSFMRQEFDLCHDTMFDEVARYLIDKDFVIREYFDRIHCKIS